MSYKQVHETFWTAPDVKKDKSHADISDKRMQDKAQKGSIEEILTNEGFEEF